MCEICQAVQIVNISISLPVAYFFMRTGNTSQVIERPQKKTKVLTHKERKKEAENPRFN